MTRLRTLPLAAAVVSALTVGTCATVVAPTDAVARPARHSTRGRGVPGVPHVLGATGVLAATVPSWAHAGPDRATPAAAPVSFVVQLQTRHAAELSRLVTQVSDPASARYQDFLTPAQYAARYAPTPAAAHAVTTWARTAGLRVAYRSRQRTFVEVHGTAGAVAAALGTRFGQFTRDGLSLRAPLSPAVLPAPLRGVVSNIAGLAQEAPLKPTASPSPVFLNARPCSSYYGQRKATTQPSYHGAKQPYAVCGYTGKQLRRAYGLGATGLAGTGATVGVVDAFASPTVLRDANTYAQRHGQHVFGKDRLVQRTPPGETSIPEDPTGLLLDPQGWAGEETLDVEAVHSMAPGARVIYQAATSPYGPALYMALGTVVESGDAQIVSNSYGTGGDSPDATDTVLFNQITDEAAATGVTINFSSGDSGDETDPSAAGERTADFPATSTGVTAVGGTSMRIDKAGKRSFETYWGTRNDPRAGNGWDFKHVVYSGAGGGGVSTSYPEPAWQKPVVPAKLATFGGVSAGRVVPDVSMDADSTTGFLTGQTQKFADGTVRYSEYRIGGTSLSCPLFSGLLALSVGQRHGKGVGLVTPALYHASRTDKGIKRLFNDPTKAAVSKATHQSVLANVRSDFTDPTDPTSKVKYSLRTLGNLATLHAYAGYDDSTGLGSPKVAAILALLKG